MNKYTHWFRVLIAISAILICATSHAGIKRNFSIATWNLEHATSADEFSEWVSFCEPLSWIDPDDRDAVYPTKVHLPYCNALNGEVYPPKPQRELESLPIHSLTEWEKKVKQSRDTLELVAPDIIAFQEVSSAEAIKAVVGGKYSVFFKKAPNVKQQLGFAIKKRYLEKYIDDVSVELFNPLSVTAQDNHKVRPGLVLHLTIHGRPFVFLNVHLKSGCSQAVLSRPDPANERMVESCQTLVKQIPILEDWVEQHESDSVVVLGDFNRSLVENTKIFPVRLDGEVPSAPHTPETRYGRFFDEISDGVPQYADLTRIPTSYISEVSGCRGGIDHIFVNQTLLEREKLNANYLHAVSIPFASGEEPVVDKVRTSDHCLHLTKLTVDPIPKVKDVSGISAEYTLNVSSYAGSPVSSLLYGFSHTNPLEKITKDACEEVAHTSSFSCSLLNEQSREISLPDDLEETQTFLAQHFVPKVQYVVGASALKDFYNFLKTKGALSTEMFESDDLVFESNATRATPSQGEYIRPHIIQAAAGVGVNVNLTEAAKIYNVGYIFGEKGPGRSYGISSFYKGRANDASYQDLFERLQYLLKYSSSEKINKIYRSLLDLLMFSSTENFEALDSYEQALLTDIYAVYLAEGFRYHTASDTEAYHDDLLTVVLLAPWAVENRLIINGEGVSEMGGDGLKDLIGYSDDGRRSGLGFFRSQRIAEQKLMCGSMSSPSPELSEFLAALNPATDCLYGFAQYVRNPALLSFSGNRQVILDSYLQWVAIDLVSWRH